MTAPAVRRGGRPTVFGGLPSARALTGTAVGDDRRSLFAGPLEAFARSAASFGRGSTAIRAREPGCFTCAAVSIDILKPDVETRSQNPAQTSEAAAAPSPKPTKLGILLRVLLFVLIGYLGVVIFSGVMLALLPQSALVVIATLSTFAAAAVANAIVVRIFERGRLADLGLQWTMSSGREFLLGAGLAAAAAVVILATPVALGLAKFDVAPTVEHRWPSIAFLAIVLLFGAMGEEMLFHGYAFQLLVRSIGAFATILPAAVLFGFAHSGNENATTLGIVNTMLWGVLLGYAYWRTNALWLPIGLHYGWNLALPLFGVNLSGFTMGVAGYTLHWRVGNLWSGGGYGPEGGLLTTGIVAVLFFAVERIFREADPDIIESSRTNERG
jgi:uncharacterized protein